MMRAALAAGNLFGWIFVFEFFYIATFSVPLALAHTVLLYALAQIIACLIIPLSARALGSGMQRQMVFGGLACAAAFVVLGGLFQGAFGLPSTIAITLFALLLGCYHALYWIPYGVERGQGTGGSRLSYEILVALIPAFAGVLLVLPHDSESLVLFCTALVIVLSLWPITLVPERYEGFRMTYQEAFGSLVARAHRRVVWSSFVDGVQGAALLLLWPIAIFLLVGWSYPLLGIIFSITCLCLLLARALIKPRASRFARSDSPLVQAAIATSAWVGRLLVVNPVSVVAVDLYMHAGGVRDSVDDLIFEQLADAGHYIDEYTVIREIGLALGRLALCIVAVVLVAYMPLTAAFGIAFLIAALCAGISVLLSRTSSKSL